MRLRFKNKMQRTAEEGGFFSCDESFNTDFRINEKGGKGGGGSSTTTQKADPWSGQQPFLKYGFKEAKDIYKDGGPQFFGDDTYTQFSDQTNQALQLAQDRALGGSQLNQGAQGFAQNVLGSNPMDRSGGVAQINATANGDYLNSNPYLDQMFGAASDQVTSRFNDTVMPGINATFGAGGRTGSGMHSATVGRAADELGNDLTNMAADVYGNNYQQERGNQLGAAGALISGHDTDRTAQANAAQMAPNLAQQDYADIDRLFGVGQQIEGKEGEALADQINRWDHEQNLPNQNLSNYVAAIQGNYGGSSSSTQKTSNDQSGLSQAGDVIGTVASLAALFSDSRLKKDIKPLGAFGPLRLVQWAWNEAGEKLGLSGESSGFIAQEVQAVAPEFVHTQNGYLAIDYPGLYKHLGIA